MKHDLKSKFEQAAICMSNRVVCEVAYDFCLLPMQGLDVKSTLKHICFHTVNRQLRDFLVS